MNDRWFVYCFTELELSAYPHILIKLGLWETRFFIFNHKHYGGHNKYFKPHRNKFV